MEDDAAHIDVLEQPLTFVAYGGGVNSTALLCGWVERGLPPPDRILFADTGGERPTTIEYVSLFSAWLVSKGYPAIISLQRVKADHVTPNTLEANCREHQTLPSLAYGFKRCSHKFKLQPQEKYMNRWAAARRLWKAGGRITKLIGFDVEERHRAERKTADAKYLYKYPLIEWGWDREDCEAAILRAGLSTPGKSSCFFCPAMTKPEILQLRAEHPDLLARALELEQIAAPNFQSVQGLGRRFAWADFLAGKPVMSCTVEQDCGCMDG